MTPVMPAIVFHPGSSKNPVHFKDSAEFVLQISPCSRHHKSLDICPWMEPVVQSRWRHTTRDLFQRNHQEITGTSHQVIKSSSHGHFPHFFHSFRRDKKLPSPKNLSNRAPPPWLHGVLEGESQVRRWDEKFPASNEGFWYKAFIWPDLKTS